MAKFAIIGTVEVPAGRREAFLPLLMAHRERCLRDEPGTLRFEAVVPRDDETRVLLFEVYRDEAAFEEHWAAPSLARLRREAGEMIVSIDGWKGALAE